MAEDKWKIIDTHVNSMIDWTKALSVTPTNNQTPSTQRQGHIHRKSEPDVVMIREAQKSKIGQLPVPPQSAPVQPGSFTLDWSSRSYGTAEENAGHEENTATEVDAFKPTTGSKSPHIIIPTPPTHRRTNSPSPRQHQATNDHEQSGFVGVEAPRPPPYQRGIANGQARTNRPYNGAADGQMSHSPRLPDNSYKAFITVKNPAGPNFGYPSPKTNRRSSMPGNHIDPRAQSASPSIPRRSTSIQPTMPRRSTHDNFITSILPEIPSHPVLPVVTIPTSFNPSPNVIMTLSNKKPDDQEYTKALLQHQQDRMQRLQKELEAKKKLLESLNATVAVKERESCEQRNDEISKCMPTPDDIRKLRDKNRQLEIECNCMIKEVEVVSSSGHNSMETNFHDSIIKKGKGKIKPGHSDPLPSPPLPPPPEPPVEEEDSKWSCKYCTFLNHSALDKCEMCDYRRHRPAVS